MSELYTLTILVFSADDVHTYSNVIIANRILTEQEQSNEAYKIAYEKYPPHEGYKKHKVGMKLIKESVLREAGYYRRDSSKG